MADLVAIGVARDLGALMTGIVMSGRTGASFAAVLGTMTVNEEVDALRTMGLRPVEFLVLPRVLATAQDGGLTWQVLPSALPEDPGSAPISAAYLNFVDGKTGFLAVKLESSSAFSLGRLFATQDGGRTWQERSLPLGEPVAYVDTQHGWTAGGPGGEQLFQTVDGGRTWQPQSLPRLFSGSQNQVLAGLPVFRNDKEGFLPLTQTGLDPRLLVYATEDGGETWSLSGQVELAEEPGMALPFRAGPGA